MTLAWIFGRDSECAAGSHSQNGCFSLSSGAEAIATAYAVVSCGLWTGRSDHGYKDGSAPIDVFSSRNTQLDAGNCPPPPPPPEDCTQYGPGYYWNGFECTDVASPIVIATNPGQYRFTSTVDGVLFDIDADGDLDQVAWTEESADVAFLALDLDGDGQITSGKELFGDYTVPNAKNGFEALAIRARASNGNIVRGSVSEEDPLYFDLLLWTDRNHNGLSEPDELRPAREVVAEIGLGYEPVFRRDRDGNQFRYKGWSHVRTSPGRNRANSANEDKARRRAIWDVFLKR